MAAIACISRPPAVRAAPAAQPALELFGDLKRLPHSYIVHRALDDDNAPLICRGEVAVVDIGGPNVTGGFYPVDGGLFLIEYCSGPAPAERYARRSRQIVQAFTDHRGRWCVGGLRRGFNGRTFVCTDGPYPDEMALADKLIGRVVGLYQPSAQVLS